MAHGLEHVVPSVTQFWGCEIFKIYGHTTIINEFLEVILEDTVNISLRTKVFVLLI